MCVIEKVAFAVQTPPLATCADRIPAACQMSKTPTLIWAQRVEKVFVTWECLATKEVNLRRQSRPARGARLARRLHRLAQHRSEV